MFSEPSLKQISTDRGIGVQVAAHVLDLELQLVLGSLRSTLLFQSAPIFRYVRRVSDLEGEVLEEVCGAVGLVSLGPGAGINPHADGRSLRPWRVLGRDLDSTGQQSLCLVCRHQLASDGGAHGQSILERRGLSLAEG